MPGVVVFLQRQLGTQFAESAEDLGSEQALRGPAVCKTWRTRPRHSAIYLVLAGAGSQGLFSSAVARRAARILAGKFQADDARARSHHSDLASGLATRLASAGTHLV